MSPEEIAELSGPGDGYNGRGHHNWGFRGGITEVQSQPLVNVRLPPWMAQRWTITLAQLLTPGAFPLQAWPASAGPVANGTGAQNAQNITTQGAAGTLQPFQVQLTWGNGGVSDVAIIDYPYAGGTFSFFACQYQLTLAAVDPVTQALIVASGRSPLFGAWAARGGSAKELGAGPLYTTPDIVQSTANGPYYVPVPPHARAYRIVFQGTTAGALTPDQSFGVSQYTGGSSGSAPVLLTFDMAGQPVGESWFSQQSLWDTGADKLRGIGVWERQLKNNVGILHPGAAYLGISVNNGEATDDFFYQVQFALDLG